MPGVHSVPGMNGGQKVKVLYGVAAATVSRTTRVSPVRLNLKEVAGKVSARRTETVYEAENRQGEFAIQNNTQSLQVSVCVDTAGIWDEVIRSYPRRSGIMRQYVKRTGVLPECTCGRKRRSNALPRCQKSAEVMVHTGAWKDRKPVMR